MSEWREPSGCWHEGVGREERASGVVLLCHSYRHQYRVVIDHAQYHMPCYFSLPSYTAIIEAFLVQLHSNMSNQTLSVCRMCVIIFFSQSTCIKLVLLLMYKVVAYGAVVTCVQGIIIIFLSPSFLVSQLRIFGQHSQLPCGSWTMLSLCFPRF